MRRIIKIARTVDSVIPAMKHITFILSPILIMIAGTIYATILTKAMDSKPEPSFIDESGKMVLMIHFGMVPIDLHQVEQGDPTDTALATKARDALMSGQRVVYFDKDRNGTLFGPHGLNKEQHAMLLERLTRALNEGSSIIPGEHSYHPNNSIPPGIKDLLWNIHVGNEVLKGPNRSHRPLPE